MSDRDIPDYLVSDRMVDRFLAIEPPIFRALLEFDLVVDEIERAYVLGLFFSALSASVVSIERLLNKARIGLHKYAPSKIKGLWNKDALPVWQPNIDALAQSALARAATAASHAALAIGVMLVIAAFIWWKYRRRAHFLLQMQTNTISPKELKDEIDRRSPLTIIDVRHALDLLSAPYTIPNAIRIPLEDLATQVSAVPREQKVVIYCTCPSQASSVRALQLLESKGFPRVQVLAGGFQAWRKSGFAVQEFQFDTAAAKPMNPIWAFRRNHGEAAEKRNELGDRPSIGTVAKYLGQFCRSNRRRLNAQGNMERNRDCRNGEIRTGGR